MKTVGQILKEARLKKKTSLLKLENLTKIKREFIVLIEKNDWDKLPDFPIVSGFVKNLAVTLDVNLQNANAVLRRDYPPKKLYINPKPDIGSKFTWSPKLTFLVGIGVLILMVLGYLGFEYLKFKSPPTLEITAPTENQIVLSGNVLVKGKTATDVKITVNNQPIIVDQDGNFVGEIEITKETKDLKFVATSRSGKVTQISRNIKVDF
ncbi:MAG: helix-turn-helix domain-containing protein [Candidatus Woesebacteria bacterium]|nr:helix-turn-helix domain-containing protein [Candidatus Woesebacteria bacterium]